MQSMGFFDNNNLLWIEFRVVKSQPTLSSKWQPSTRAARCLRFSKSSSPKSSQCQSSRSRSYQSLPSYCPGQSDSIDGASRHNWLHCPKTKARAIKPLCIYRSSERCTRFNYKCLAGISLSTACYMCATLCQTILQ